MNKNEEEAESKVAQHRNNDNLSDFVCHTIFVLFMFVSFASIFRHHHRFVHISCP
jgi:hypothetical protein